MPEPRDLFEQILRSVGEVAVDVHLPEPQAFIRWFVGMYFSNPHDLMISDGSRDGKVDAFFTTHDGIEVTHHVVNSKFTRRYNDIAPPAFYSEINAFVDAFQDAPRREEYLQTVKAELRPRYRELFGHFDLGRARLMFITNHRTEDDRVSLQDHLPVQVFGLDDLLQYVVDDLDGAMPRTDDLVLAGIETPLTIDAAIAEMNTSIVFARLIDFINYMVRDPSELLFARNVRVPIPLSASQVNRDIRDTFRLHPREFAYSSNGITVICEAAEYDAVQREYALRNPRVINGSQTLHSVRDVPNPSPDARVLVRVVVIPPLRREDLEEARLRRRNIISDITIRTNAQNVVKKWDLVSGDEFQADIFRFFRRKKLFYERKTREWGERSRALRSRGVRRGPSVKKMMQLLACYYWDRPGLGPAHAKNSVAGLFDVENYGLLQQTSAELVYQVFLVSEAVRLSWRDLEDGARAPRYLRQMRGHAALAVVARVLRCLSAARAAWGDPQLTDLLESSLEDDGQRLAWRRLVADVAAGMHRDYAMALRTAENRARLTLNNFFKTDRHVRPSIARAVPTELRQFARQLVR